jgi:single-strand DNA-binding protein
MNLVVLQGNLGKDAEVKVFDSGNKCARFSLATSENYKKGDEWETITQWHNVVAWGYLAEKAGKLKKGEPVLIHGKVTYREVTSENGDKKFYTDIVATSVKGFTKKEGDGNSFPSEEGAGFAAPVKADDFPVGPDGLPF